MMIMDEETVSPELLGQIAARWEGWELAEFLDLSAEEIALAFEDKVVAAIDEIAEELDIVPFEVTEDGEVGWDDD